MKLEEFIRKNFEKIRKSVEKRTKTLWSGRTYEDYYRNLKGKTSKYPVEEQKKVIGQLVEGVLKNKTVFLAGQTGVGKTIMALYAAYVLHKMKEKGMRVLIVCPDRNKENPWKNHIKEIFGEEARVRIVESVSEMMEIRNEPKVPEKLEFVIVGEGSFKGNVTRKTLHPFVIQTEKGELVFKCPECCKKLTYKYFAKTHISFEIKEQKKINPVDLPVSVSEDTSSGYVREKNVIHIMKNTYICPFCGYTNKKLTAPGKVKYPLADIVKDYLKKHFQLAIVDEGSNYRNKSKRGLTLGRIKFPKIILSGTFITGYPVSLFYPLMQTLGREMRKRGFTFKNVNKFQATYGFIKKKVNGKKKTKVYPAPGVKPELVMFVRKFSTFISLEDVKENLPPLNYFYEPVKPYEEMLEEYKKLKRIKENSFAAIRALVVNGLSAPDLMFKENRYDDVLLEPVAEILPKELKLVEIIEKEREEGRKCLVYVMFTQKRDVSKRLKEVLEEHGINAKLLPDVKQEKREEYLKEIARYTDAVILHPTKVSQGVNLQEYPTIIWFQPTWDTDLFKQASSRSYRFDQTKEVRVYMLYYTKTIQEDAFFLVNEKTAVADIFEGRITQTIEFATRTKNSIIAELARKMLQNQMTVATTS